MIKSKMRALIQLYGMVSSISEAELNVLDKFRAEREDEVMDTEDVSKLGPLGDELFALAVQIMLVPAAHSLQLLVSDQGLERQLRK